MYILHSFSNNACFNENFSDFALESVQRRLWIAPLLTAAQCSGSLADEDMTGLLSTLEPDTECFTPGTFAWHALQSTPPSTTHVQAIMHVQRACRYGDTELYTSSPLQTHLKRAWKV